METKKKVLISSAVALVLVVIAIVLLVVFLPKGHTHTHTLGEDTYEYELGKYIGTCTHKGCDERTWVEAGSEQYPYLIKDDETALSSLAFVKARQTGEDALTDKLYLKLVDDVTIGEGKTETDAASIEHFVVEKEMNVVLDLNGHSILDKTQKTIDNFGTLTIVDNSQDQDGFVDVLAFRSSAVVNEMGGTFTLNSGRLYRSTKGNDPESDGFISHYVFTNYGTATINGGKIHAVDGCYWGYPVDNSGGKWTLNTCSSLIDNGWSDAAGHGNQNGEFPNEGLAKVTPAQPLRDPVEDANKFAVLTINGGEFLGGKVVLKNDFYGKVVINGGKFSTGMDNDKVWDTRTENGTGAENLQEGVFNNVAGAELTINGGEFTITNNGKYVIKNAGTTTVNGGKFTVEDCTYVVTVVGEATTTISEKATLTGNVTTDEFQGTVTGDFTKNDFEVLSE